MRLQQLKMKRRLRRKAHIRKHIFGVESKPRLTVFKSNLHIYAQLIDDTQHKTLVSASSVDKEIRQQITAEMNKSKQGELVGEMLAKKALQANISEIQFDRNGYSYHGRIKAIAEGARKGGLKF